MEKVEYECMIYKHDHIISTYNERSHKEANNVNEVLFEIRVVCKEEDTQHAFQRNFIYKLIEALSNLFLGYSVLLMKF